MPQHFHGSITVRVPGDFQQVGVRWITTVQVGMAPLDCDRPEVGALPSPPHTHVHPSVRVQDKPLEIYSGNDTVTRTETPLRPVLHRIHTDPAHYKSFRSTILPQFASYQTCEARF
eukprot:7378255-Prymnesium_polylepis.1